MPATRRNSRFPLDFRHVPLILVGSILIASVASADLLYFKNGAAIQAPATSKTDEVLIDLSDGKHAFLKADFRSRVPGFDPAAEVAGRFQEARRAGLSAWFDAVWWAIENGLIEPAVGQLRELHRANPDHLPSARMAGILDRLDRPCRDPDIEPFRRALVIPMTSTRSPHILLLHQRSEEEAGARVELLEKVIAGYYLFFASQGVELKVPERRLVFAWMNEQQDYLTFLRSQNAVPFLTTRGYYHPTWNAVVAYDARSTDIQKQGLETAAARRAELGRFKEMAERMPARSKARITLAEEPARTLGKADALALASRLEREVERDELILDLDRRSIDEGTAVHEMVHLLAANSGLLPRHDAFPRWLQEGLAMQFEVMRGGRWAGISRAHDLRLPDWRKAEASGKLEPLIRDTGFGRGYQRDAYAQAWSLVYYLRTRHSNEFLTFLDLLRGPETSPTDLEPAERYHSTFRRAFGNDLDSLDRDWHAFMATVQTPLERHAPPTAPQSSPPRRAPSR